MPEPDDNSLEKPSKTQLKKEMIALQKLGEALIDLSDSQLDKMLLPETLLRAILLARTLTSHGAIRRQSQLIGKLMRHLDPEPIQADLQKVQEGRAISTEQFHDIEKWRDELIANGDDGLQKWLELYPMTDRQQLRQLIRNAQRDRANNKKTGGEIELFKYLRGVL